MKNAIRTDSKKVAVALSGGIDSLVAGYLIKQDYSEVFGIHFSTGYENKDIDLSGISKQLDIKIEKIDLSTIFKKKIVNYFINTYLSGETPNPCILCNKIIKFGALLDAAKGLGATALATGHYAKTINTDNRIKLVKGSDILKEQSYFLSSLSENQLTKIVFPLGDLTKKEVRTIANNQSLSPIEKKESQDICFLENESVAEFINSKLNIKSYSGNIITIEGKVIGTHKGLYNYTIGQRRGLNCPASEPYYVKHIDTENNNIVVCFKNKLLRNRFNVYSLNWLKKDIKFPLNVTTKIRYNHQDANSKIYKQGKDIVEVIFEKKQFAITPGQTAVFYNNNEVVGSGIIQ